MKGDFSRIRFTPEKNYTAVLQQQGRVALDADANEQTAIDAHLRDTTNFDVIGKYGAPANDEGFAIWIENGKIRIGRGRYYVDGILVENDRDRDYADQWFLKFPPVPPAPADASSESSLIAALESGTSVQFVLQVWRRLVTELDDPCLVEPAIGQADTTARLQTVWRVIGTTADPKTAPAGTGNTIPTCSCCCDGLHLSPLPAHSGSMTAIANPPSDDCGCQPIPAAGYQGLENQLYRVEIHAGGDYSAATFKWSRENASVVAQVTQLNGSPASGPGTCVVTVNSLGPDANLGFQVNQWVEVTDDYSLFGDTPNQPGVLYQIVALGPTGSHQVTLSGTPGTPNVDTSKNARMRRWDQPITYPSTGIPVSSGTVTLEYGIEVAFGLNGNYVPGDYWTIPARTASGQIDWACGSKGDPYLPPHYFEIYQAPLAYARWDKSTEKAVLSDCRTFFSPLGEVDLAFHNKHLHGWGIVCGLQVNCGSNRTQVTVKKGYAIDCEGRDVRICCDVPLNLLAMAKSLLDGGSGTVSLVLNSDGTFAVEKQDKAQETLGSYFQNTFWEDFWKKCVQPLITFVTSQFSGGQGSASLPVGPTQKRIDTLYNLLYQLIHPVNGQHLFVSPEEDTILRDFYNGFKQVLTSRTFCGLFDKARAFPVYPFSPPTYNVHGIFGLGEHTRIRVNPNGGYAYTVGTDNFIHVYDLDPSNLVMVAKTPFPNYAGAVVQDVAVAPDGSFYAIAQVNSSSVCAMAAVSGASLTWNTPSIVTLPGVKLTTLAVSSSMVYAVGTGAGSGPGLYAITPGQPIPTSPTFPISSPSLFGHLVIDSVGGVAYMTAYDSTLTADATTFNCVLAQNLNYYETPPGHGYQRPEYPLKISDETQFVGTAIDDIAVVVDSATDTTKLYVSVNSRPAIGYTNKQLLVFTIAAQTAPPNRIDLQNDDTPIRLAVNSTNSTNPSLLIAYASYNWVYVLDPSKNELYSQNNATLQFPTEWYPYSIAVGPSSQEGSQTVYILNAANMTITAAPAGMLMPSPSASVSLKKLATYRDGVLEAFADLLGLILQDLKDCFCNRFLVNCPACDGEEKLYLGDIQIVDSQVYKICNLDRRRYVKSFPTYGYWLSIIPILPLMKYLVAELCCYVLPDFFSKYKAEPTLKSRDLMTNDQTSSAMNFLKSINLTGIRQAQFTKLATSGGLATDSIRQAVFNFTPAPAVQINQGDVVGQQTQAVTQRLSAFNITVDAVQPYDPSAAATNLTAFLGAPTTLASGSHVVLYEQNGVVRYYALTPKPSAAMQSLTTQVQAQQTALSGLEASQQLIANQQQTIATHQQEIAALKTALSEMKHLQDARDRDLSALQSQVRHLVNHPPQG